MFVPTEKVVLEENAAVRIDIVSSGPPPTPVPGALYDSSGKLLSLGLGGPVPPDFKELGEEWREYAE